jgi:hypothetical protein
MELGPEVHMEDASKGTQASPFPVEGSMCGRSDRVVFSCPVGDGNKVASMCAGGDIASGHGRFYYAYGRPGTPELTYPTKNQADGEFTRTHLGLTGNRSGYAFAFSSNGYKYVVYATSGGRNEQDGGVIVQRDGQSKAVAKMQCQFGRISQTDSDQLIDATLQWKSDRKIEMNGLPVMR